MTTERKVYTEEFKRDAVRLAKERGNIAQTARDPGISDNTLQGWKLQMEKTPANLFPGNGNPRDAEFVQLQLELLGGLPYPCQWACTCVGLGAFRVS